MISLKAKLLSSRTIRRWKDRYHARSAARMSTAVRAARSWSQHGEDTWLLEKLGSTPTGFYVDVGANHPSRLSNTYRLHAHGWRGLCVEPNQDLLVLHRQFRPGDLQIGCGLNVEDTLLPFYEFSFGVLSTFSRAEADKAQADGAKLISITWQPVFSLATILDATAQHRNGPFALLSVDTEGYDEIVLQGNDWQRFRPRFVIVELKESTSAAAAFLEAQSYRRVHEAGVNAIFETQ